MEKGVKKWLLQNGSKIDEKWPKIDAKIDAQKVGLKMIKMGGYKLTKLSTHWFRKIDHYSSDQISFLFNLSRPNFTDEPFFLKYILSLYRFLKLIFTQWAR
jgi:hypothetical protein